MDRDEYAQKVLSILSDASQFEKLDCSLDGLFPVCIKQEEKLARILRKLRSQGAITRETYGELLTSGSRPGILYGLPKTHKTNIPMRPILSTIGTFNYKLAKFLVPLLAPFTKSEYSVNNSFEFADEISTDRRANISVMASFDVTSLFTSIPLDGTVALCLDLLYSSKDSAPTINKRDMELILNLAVKESLFLFNGTLYKQLDGVGMGSPLAPTLANIFMAYHEKIWLNECPTSFKPLLYRRCVDDTFSLFSNVDQINEFLQYLNCKHPRIKFTCEQELSGRFPSLTSPSAVIPTLKLAYTVNPQTQDYILCLPVSSRINTRIILFSFYSIELLVLLPLFI